jgi:hypothetical protein
MRTGFLFLTPLILILMGCGKYESYENMEVVEDSFSGAVMITSANYNPSGDYMGNGDSGKYSFAYDIPEDRALVSFDISASSGSVQLIMRGRKGEEVFNESLSTDGFDAFSGISGFGKEGVWLVEIIFEDFDGEGSFSFTPVE